MLDHLCVSVLPGKVSIQPGGVHTLFWLPGEKCVPHDEING
jgi:hypothetical protein